MNAKEKAFYERHVQAFVRYLPNLFYPDSVPFDIEATTSDAPIPFGALSRCRFREMREGEVWGRNWSSAWFRLRGTVPRSWRGKTVVARLNIRGEACVFSREGEPLQGLTSGSMFDPSFARDRYSLFARCRGGERVMLWVEAAANDLFGLARDEHPRPDAPYREQFEGRLECVRLCVFRKDIWHLWIEALLLEKLMGSLPERDPRRAQILCRLTEAASRFRYDRLNPAEIRRVLAPALSMAADGTQLVTTAVGHAHIDAAWLWPIRETIRKCARTFSSQLRLLETYPDYVFGASQAQLYQFVKDRYPSLYRRIRRAVAAGRWEVQGAMWVEADCNVTGGESLTRQVLYGKRFFREEFGVDVRHLWLPDVFGYSAALPQILRRAGVNAFLTLKMSWSQFNRFPHHTFRWQGIDGTEILTHFPPEDTYNGCLQPDRLRYAADNFEERGFLPEFLTLFGIGDGGGGPTEEMIETGRLQAGLAGCPRVRFGPAQPFFNRLARRAGKLPVWSGELYLELHRGTLTTQAANKRLNRQCELALRRAEILHAGLPFHAYPGPLLERLWKTVLMNQFHDIIPGSCIREVYDDSKRQYREVLESLAGLETRALRRFRRHHRGNAVSVLNLLSHTFHGVVRFAAVQGKSLVSEDGRRHLVQPCREGGGWVALDVRPLSAVCLEWDPRGASAFPGARASLRPVIALENDKVRYEFDTSGQLRRMLDKEQRREFMRPGDRGNRLTLYQDWPQNFDAWDVDITYEQQVVDTAQLKTIRLGERGPAVASLVLRWRIGQSEIAQEIRLTSNSRRLDFVTRVAWRECRKMLRAAFPVDVIAPEAIFEIQYGVCRRPTHRNTSWDMARFEVCGHRFADLSGPDGGVALLNDCKYGYKVLDRTLDLNLLRAPWYPDPTADRGEQVFIYSLLPHTERFEESRVVAEAHALNQPLVAVRGDAAFPLPFILEGRRVVLETIKKAEAEEAWVIRLYEPVGRRAACTLHPINPRARLWEAGIMENRVKAVPFRKGAAALAFQPFEIKTLLLTDGRA